MIGAVGLQVAGAVAMKLLADAGDDTAFVLVLLVIGMVGALNVGRLVVWRAIHERHPISASFPLSSLFFPAMLVVALAFGDELGVSQYLGALLIAIGVWALTRAEVG